MGLKGVEAEKQTLGIEGQRSRGAPWAAAATTHISMLTACARTSDCRRYEEDFMAEGATHGASQSRA